jgi:sterol desaturase/sphingolipid hydroxylase (fatty acid hydroxylase superfamily)
MIFFIIGFLLWIVLEYLMHRYFLHGMVHPVHRTHHKDPKDMSELFIGWKNVAVASVVLCGIALLFLSATSVMLLYMGVVLGYFMYEFVHYKVHYCKPTSKFLLYLRKHHLRHHYVTEDGNYSILFPFLDRIMRTKI